MVCYYQWLQNKVWFLKHYNEDYKDLFENKPVDVEVWDNSK